MQRSLLISSGAAYGTQNESVERLIENDISAPSTVDIKSTYGEGKDVWKCLGPLWLTKRV